jgi:V8-like Glu-specific endopeptidase
MYAFLYWQVDLHFSSNEIPGCDKATCGNIAIHDCTEYSGQSGSPIYTNDTNGYTIKAILTGVA